MPQRPDLTARNRAHRTSFRYEDAEWLTEAYWTRGLTLRQIAAEADCSVRTVCRWMETHGIPTDRSRIGNNPGGSASPLWTGKRVCPACGGTKTTRAVVCARCRDRSGARNPKWIGDGASYWNVHQRVAAERGQAAAHRCACGAQARHWAYDHTDPAERRGPTKPGDTSAAPYSLDLSRYAPMCVPCHRSLDIAHKALSRP